MRGDGHRRRRVPFVLFGLACLIAACDSNCDDNANRTSPSGVGSLTGTVSLQTSESFAISFDVERAGILSTLVDWNSGENDVDSAILSGKCTTEQIAVEAAGCVLTDALFSDSSAQTRPSELSGAVEIGNYTLVILNFGPSSEECSYRITTP